MLHIWYVILSSQLCTLSALEIIAASLLRMTASECSGLPNAFRWFTHFRHSSTMARWLRAETPHMTHRSWLKLLSMTKMPPPSSPSVFSTGTLTLSKVMYAVPAAAEYDVLIGLVETPSLRSTRITVKPSSVLQPTVKLPLSQLMVVNGRGRDDNTH